MRTKPLVEIDIKKVEALAANGLTMQEISDALGIHPATLYRRKAKETEIQAAIRRGRAKGLAVVTNKLMEQAKAGNIAAIIFYLKARAGWRDTQSIDVTNSDGSLSPLDVTVTYVNPEEQA